MPRRHQDDDEDTPDDESVRRVLATMSTTQLSEILNCANWYLNLRPEAKIALERADEKVLEWITTARPDEIELVTYVIKLASSGRTVATFMKWALITAIGAFILASQFQEALKNLFGLKLK